MTYLYIYIHMILYPHIRMEVFDRSLLEYHILLQRVLESMITHWKIPVNEPQSLSCFM